MISREKLTQNLNSEKKIIHELNTKADYKKNRQHSWIHQVHQTIFAAEINQILL